MNVIDIPQKIAGTAKVLLNVQRAPDDNAHLIDEFLSAASSNSYGCAMTMLEVAFLKAYKNTDRSLQLLPIVPNVPGFIREATEYGLAGAGIRRVKRVGASGVLRLGAFGAFKSRKVLLKRDFPTILSILCEMEMNEFRKFKPPVVFLQQQMTDLMLALNNRRVFENFARHCRKRYRSEPGLVTANFARLAEKLIEWDTDISVIAAPVNRENFLMPANGDTQGIATYQKAVESGRFQIIATRLAANSDNESDALKWALAQQGVIAGVVESV